MYAQNAYWEYDSDVVTLPLQCQSHCIFLTHGKYQLALK